MSADGEGKLNLREEREDSSFRSVFLVNSDLKIVSEMHEFQRIAFPFAAASTDFRENRIAGACSRA